MSIQNRLIIMLLLDTGVRRNELLHIELKNIDLINNRILLTETKTKKDRYVFFRDETKYKYIIPYMKTISSSKYLFNISSNGFMSLFERIKKRLNFSKFHAHMLRHTHATLLLKNNANLELIRILLGHSNLNTTKKYLHSNLDMLSLMYKQSFYL